MKDIRISPCLNGFIVKVGCQTLAYTSIDKLILDLGAYLRDPKATEQRIIEAEGFNREHTLSQEVSAPRGLIQAGRSIPQECDCDGECGSSDKRPSR